jgi:hypothetical protein
MKLALVLDAPSLGAPPGKWLTDFEQKVTNRLQEQAGFHPDATFCLYPKPVSQWRSLFIDRGCSQASQLLLDAQTALLPKLEGFDVALTMGTLAMWALTGQTALDNYRGTHIDSPYVTGLQVVPTYNPDTYCNLAWHEQPIVAAAMRKATSRYVDKKRTIYVPETVEDVTDFIKNHVSNEIAFDVETNLAARITEFGLSPDPTSCLYVALEDWQHKPLWTADEELAIFVELAKLAQRSDLTWIFHNSVYDLSYLCEYGIFPQGPIVDTMLQHHSWQPEFEKSLGFLSSLHITGRAWKHLRKQAKAINNKAGAL